MTTYRPITIRALVIAAHPDDEYLGCGATAYKLLRLENVVEHRIVGGGRLDALDNRLDTVALLDIVKRIEAWISDFKPNRIYTHSKADLNVDHLLVHRAVLTATRPGCCEVQELFAFETASSTEWNFGSAFAPSLFEEVTGDDIEWKLRKLNDLYPNEMRDFPHPRSRDYLEASAKRWGGVAGVSLAEAFEVVRVIR